MPSGPLFVCASLMNSGGLARAGFLAWDLLTFLAGLRQTNSDRLLAALDFAAFASLTRTERTTFPAAHSTGHSFASAFAVATAAGLFLCWHTSSCLLETTPRVEVVRTPELRILNC